MFSASKSPIHRLPVELLSRIFLEGVSDDFPYAQSPFLFKPNQPTYREDDPSIRSPNFQLWVSHVCKHWREIALNMACLWTTIHLSSPKHLPRAKEYIRRCLQLTDSSDRHRRSPTQLLDIMVDTVSPNECRQGRDLCKDHFDDVFEIIMPHVLLWRSFHLKVRDHACKALARKYLCAASAGPHLETLQLYHFEAFGDARDLYLATYRPPVIVFHNHLPKLRNVSLIGVNLNWAESNFLCNLDNLQLALHSDNIRPPYTFFSAMLRDSPSLRTLSLHYSGPKNHDGDPANRWALVNEPMTLQSLTDLSLVDLDPGYVCAIMERLTAPSLTKLTLELSQPDIEFSEWDYTSFINLLVKGREINLLGPAPSHSASSSSPANGSPPPHSPSSPTLPTTNVPSIHQPPSQVLPVSHTLNENSSPEVPAQSQSSGLRTIPIRPVPDLSGLRHLVITALVCDLESWRLLLRSLTGLQALEIDFDRLSSCGRSSDEDEDASTEDSVRAVRDQYEPRESSPVFFNVLMEGEYGTWGFQQVTELSSLQGSLPISSVYHLSQDEDKSRCSSSSSTPPTRLRVPLLPSLRVFKMSGLSGPQVKEFIVYREGGWLRQAMADASPCINGAMPVKVGPSISGDSTPSHLTANILRDRALDKYIVRRGSQQEDRVLDGLLKDGCWVSAIDLPCLGHAANMWDDENGLAARQGWLVTLEEELGEEIEGEEDDDSGDEYYDEEQGEDPVTVNGHSISESGSHMATEADEDEWDEDEEEDSDYET